MWGFSQGATAAAILTALLERPQLHPAFKGISHPPFKFAIISCGFLPLGAPSLTLSNDSNDELTPVISQTNR